MPFSRQVSHILGHLITSLIIILFLSGCGGGSGGSQSSAPSTAQQGTTDYKVNELEFMDAELRRQHPDLFFTKTQTIYQRDLDAFINQAPGMTDTEFRLEMAKFIAELGDQHTYISMPTQIMSKFPVKVWWQENKAIVIETSNEYQALLGQELLSIDGTPLWEIKDVAMSYLAYQNNAWKDAFSPQFIHLADVLENEGIISTSDMATFVFQSVDQETTQLDINSQETVNDWVRIEDLAEETPLYHLSNDNYFHTVNNGILYIQYNSAQNMAGYPLVSFIGDLQTTLSFEEINKVVVDIRFNYGGTIDHFIPVIEFLAATEFNSSDKLFVLTGRNSFSSAVGAIYSFEELTEATFVGGPTGGKPNGFSHVIGYRLSGSLNGLFMSTFYLEITNEDVDSFYPEHQIMFTQQDFLQGQDPVINFIQTNWPQGAE